MYDCQGFRLLIHNWCAQVIHHVSSERGGVLRYLSLRYWVLGFLRGICSYRTDSGYLGT